MIKTRLQKLKTASRKLMLLSDDQRNQILNDLAADILVQQEKILHANQLDLAKMDKTDPLYDRLQLTAEGLVQIAESIKQIAQLPSPLNQILETKERPNGLKLTKVTVPIGVIGVVYEARPNVTFDVFGLCFKSGNACVLKGGSAAHHSNQAIVELLPSDYVYLAPPDRSVVQEIITANDYIDVIIPRGSQNLINFVRDNASVPVIETGAGIVHTYIDQSANLEWARNIILNAKTRRPSVCNSLDTVLLDEELLPKLKQLTEPLAAKSVTIYADESAFTELKKSYPAELLKPVEPEHYGHEFLSLQMTIKTVSNLEAAIEHIQKYSSQHSEAIIADDQEVLNKFIEQVDAAAVYTNASTAFTDGGEFGFGAEIGISTQKLHARGPMGLPELTSYKWLVEGSGQVR